MTRRALIAAGLALPSTIYAQDRLFAVNFAGNLYELNTTTASGTFIGATGVTRLNAATADASGNIYAARVRNTADPADENQFVSIDPSSGQASIIASYGTSNDLRALAYLNGTLYGIRDGAPDDLVTIDAATGAVTLVGPTGRSDIQGLTAGPGGHLYGVGVGTTGGNLVRIDPATGIATVLTTALGGGSDIQAIEWDLGSNAYIARDGLRLIDFTGAPATLLGATGILDIRGLALISAGGPACYANCDGSTNPPILNVADFGCFLTKFAAGDLYANCDNSTTPPVLNVADFGCFLTSFAAGCR
jgi:hypothetical protein